MTKRMDVGSWGLFCGKGGRQLVRVDGDPCGPLSARKMMLRFPRQLLLDEERIVRCHSTGEDIAETCDAGGRRWMVRVHPVVSPRSKTVVAVLAGVFTAERAPAEPPLVGCWEWEIDRKPDGQPSSQRRTYWDESLFRIYDVDLQQAEQRQGYWEAGKWANELIDQADQMRVNSSIRDGIRDGLMINDVGRFRCLTYHVVTGYGSSHRGIRHLRLVGMVAPISPQDTKIFLRGFSYEVPNDFHDMAFEQNVNAARVDDLLRTVIEMSPQPMAVVDAATLDVLMTSPSWRREDFGHIGGFGDFVVNDSDVVSEFITEAAQDFRRRTRTTEVDLRRHDGAVQRVTLIATGVSEDTENMDTVIRLDF